ncbi:MAG: RNA polymerase sigma factor [Pygmaiobacter sp.]
MQDIEQLFLLYYKNLYHYLLSLTHDASTAEDLVSETYCKALQSLADFKEQSSAKTWLFSIARHLWLQQLRRQGRELVPFELLELVAEDTLQDTVAQNETIAQLRRLLLQKDARAQRIVQLRLQGLSYAEIGEHCHITEGSARVIDFRTRQWLKQMLLKEGYL